MKTTACSIAGLSASLSCLNTKTNHGMQRPNIIWILADDLGYGDLGCYGNQMAYTPNLDRLAQQGVRMTDFYVSAPVCSPTRASLLTGRCPQRCGLPNVIETLDDQTSLPKNEILISQILKQHGYTTGMFGKWHLGRKKYIYPLNRGFDRFFGSLHGGIGFFNHDYVDGENILWDQDRLVTRHKGEYITDLIAKNAANFIRENKNRPFFMYLSFFAVHTAMGKTEKGIQAPKRWLDFYEKKNISNKQKKYYACASAMDQAIGEVLNELHRQELDENTFIAFASDNGPAPHAGGTARPLSGTKHQMWQGGFRVPTIIKWPGHIPQGQIRSKPTIIMDFFPTSLDVAGISYISDRKLDGQNILTYLEDNSPPAERTFCWSYVRDTKRISREKVVRRGRWVWLDGELYDITRDISENHNLADQYPDIARQLEAAWNKWIQQFPDEANRWKGRRPLRNGAKVTP